MSIMGGIAACSGVGSGLLESSLRREGARARLGRTIIKSGVRTLSFRYPSPSILIIFNKLEQTNQPTK